MAILVLCQGLGCGPRGSGANTAGEADAQQLYRRAIDQRLALRYGAADSTLRLALARDPAFLPALFELTRLHEPTFATMAFLDTLASRTPDADIASCYRHYSAILRGTVPETPPARGAVRFCRGYLLLRGAGRIEASMIAEIARLHAAHPSAGTLGGLLGGLEQSGKWDSVVAVAREHIDLRQPPDIRAGAHVFLIRAEHHLGNHAAAEAAEAAAEVDPAWTLPGFRQRVLSEMAHHEDMPVLDVRSDSALRAHAKAVAERSEAAHLDLVAVADVQARWALLAGAGTRSIDRGRLTEATVFLRAALAAADSFRDPALVAYTRMRFGRALVKLGRARDAERQLLAARQTGASTGWTTLQAEVEHNLLHLYDALHRDPEARHAGKGFIAFTARGANPALWMMANRDFAMYLRVRGQVAESRPYFERMLARIDSMRTDWYFAGEYHEIVGDMESAQREYERAYRNGELRAMQGLVRVALAMGDKAGARRWAEIHDGRDGGRGPESAPLLPGVIAASGDIAAAREATERARAATAGRGQKAAWAGLTVDAAALEIERGNIARGLSLADSAEPVARSVGAADFALRARALAAFARAKRSDADGSARSALVSLAEASRSAPVHLRAEIARLVAASYGASGHWRPALDWYGRAADPLDSIAALIAVDPAQARYRSAQRRIYDDALALVLRHAADPGAHDAFVRWSLRRKARAYAVRLHADAPARDRGAPSGAAIVDYVLLDTIAAAMVWTPRRTHVVRLATTPSDIRALIEQLYAAMDVRIGSAIDASRARFPLRTAHHLYLGLVAPLEHLLAETHTLIVVPDGALGVVPFDALVAALPVDGDESRAVFLMDRFAIAGAATAAIHPDAWRLPDGGVVAVTSRRAPAAAREGDAIRSVLGDRRTIVVSGEPRERLAVLARDAGILHFAVHARANALDPSSSFLDLDAGDEGILGAAEVARLSLPAPLVVLSACETARGPVLDGEGVLSLNRSFLRAGARATVSTLWPVGSAASDFTTAFYDAARSTDLPTAMRTAKRRMRAAGASAYAWAPFQLVAGPARAAGPRLLASDR